MSYTGIPYDTPWLALGAAAAYLDNDVIGVADNALTTIKSSGDWDFCLHRIMMQDLGQVKKDTEIWLWNGTPGTIADNGAFTYADAIADQFLGVWTVTTEDYRDVGATFSVASVTLAQPALIRANSTVYLTLVAAEAITLTAQLKVKLTVTR